MSVAQFTWMCIHVVTSYNSLSMRRSNIRAARYVMGDYRLTSNACFRHNISTKLVYFRTVLYFNSRLAMHVKKICSSTYHLTIQSMHALTSAYQHPPIPYSPLCSTMVICAQHIINSALPYNKTIRDCSLIIECDS